MNMLLNTPKSKINAKTRIKECDKYLLCINVFILKFFLKGTTRNQKTF